MTAHTHTRRTPGCFRCELNADEIGISEPLIKDMPRLLNAVEAVLTHAEEWREGDGTLLGDGYSEAMNDVRQMINEALTA